MVAPTQLQSSDKALTSLFEQYSVDPSMQMGIRLSKALIARGHAAEALQITDYSLSLEPTNTEGRIQRAAALIELSRAKAAFVELQRIIALNSSHAKAIRMLGQVYVDLGYPERAANLLRKRMSQAASEQRTEGNQSSKNENVPAVRSNRIQVPTIKSNAGRAEIPVIGDLFASLTNDLGLGGFPTDFAHEGSQVEVTQVVRARIRQKPTNKEDELTSLAGPIVDRSRPERADSSTTGSTPGTIRPSTPYDIVTSTELHHTWDEDDNIKDNPFKISPITGQIQLAEENPTLEETFPRLPSSNILDSDSARTSNGEGTKPPDFLSTGPTPAGTTKAPYLKRFVKGTPVRPESDSYKDTQLHDAPQKTKVSYLFSVIMIVLAFALGMLVASSNEKPEKPPTSVEDNTPSKALKKK